MSAEIPSMLVTNDESVEVEMDKMTKSFICCLFLFFLLAPLILEFPFFLKTTSLSFDGKLEEKSRKHSVKFLIFVGSGTKEKAEKTRGTMTF
uniref:Ovule protein n=1 Tax=Caenorhabditis tropicalis TaxID=1561998 RepID=A0A1I7SZE8_9PELO